MRRAGGWGPSGFDCSVFIPFTVPEPHAACKPTRGPFGMVIEGMTGVNAEPWPAITSANGRRTSRSKRTQNVAKVVPAEN